MFASLQSLKTAASAEATRAYMNKTRDEILENAYRRGFSKEEQFEISPELKADMAQGWSQGSMSIGRRVLSLLLALHPGPEPPGVASWPAQDAAPGRLG